MMARLAGLAGVAVIIALLFGFAALMDLLHVNGPQLPQWAIRPISWFVAGFVLSLMAAAFWAGKSWYERKKPPWISDGAMWHGVFGRRRILILMFVVGVTGIFFLASAFQTVGYNAFGQWCGLRSGCWHPEWVAIGSGLAVC